MLLLFLLLPLVLAAADAPIRGFSSRALAAERGWEQKARKIPDAERVREYILRLSDEPHHAGSPGAKKVAEYLAALLRDWGLDASIKEFEALLPTPTSRQLELVAPVKFQARLQEPRIPEDKDSADAGQLPTFNAYSAAGNLTAPLVYVNYGVPEDYETLKKMDIDVRGKIVLARYGVSWRGVKPKVAYEHGAVGCLIYSDPKEDGYWNGDLYPNGPFRPKDGVQRGSVIDMAVYPGDPLSPGWASEKGSRRLPLSEARTLQKIPVLPISYADATPLLENLRGPVAPESWRGALPLTYHIGPGPASVHLQLDFDWSTRPLYNVIARIPGADFPEQWVMYGNHHDAWVNGAADPCSGAAALLETARTLAELGKQGWKPKRTILLALWDGEEWGLIGSTEWAEKYAAELDRKLVAYLNSDMNGRGRLTTEGSHTLETFLSEVIRDVSDPPTGKSLLDLARLDKNGKPTEFHLGPLGSGSDYSTFIHHLGIASLNLGFTENEARGVYHSIYDSFDWYNKFSDTTYQYGRALSQITSSVLLRLAGAPLLPFEFGRFAQTVDTYLVEIGKLPGAGALDLNGVRKELAQVKKTARRCEARYQRAVEKSSAARPESLAAANELLFASERSMLLAAGLPGRDWFKHQIYAPGLYTGYGAKTLPGIREAAEAGRWDEAARQAGNVTRVLRAVREHLERTERALARL